MILRCRACRYVLCRDVDIVHGLSTDTKGNGCTQYYFDDQRVPWFSHVIDSKKEAIDGDMTMAVKDKLYCPSCHAKIGLYDWAGDKCGCGEWIIPAMALNKSKVDVMK